uniref:Catalase core domain-containing protein n=1 Tax=Bionectria ochroleuca TaxID=29856 RepID=A0A8H7N1X7_BIOOC
MPLSDNKKIVENSEELIVTLRKIFGKNPGVRPVHAKGLLLEGTFTPTAEASSLSSAPHFKRASTPVVARFSNASGFPQLPDTDKNSIANGPFFPVKNAEEALGFFGGVADGTVEQFVATHPAAARAVTAPKKFPVSLATQKYFGIHAFKFFNAESAETYIRYRFVPKGGEKHLDDEDVKTKPDGYLFDALPGIVKSGSIEFDIVAQIAEEGDVTDDATAIWPEDRKIIKLGTVSLNKIKENNEAEQKHIIFDPVPRVDGIEPSNDPLIDLRATIYLLSGKDRRAA